MEENVKLIGLFVARTFEENNLNFIHAMQNLGKKEGYKFVIFSMDTTTPSRADSTPAEAELCGLAEYLPLEAFIILGETIKNMELIDELQESHGDGISHAFVWTGKREVVIRSVMIILPDLRKWCVMWWRSMGHVVSICWRDLKVMHFLRTE